jgi:histidine phosphotransfer protein HptB
MKPAPPRRRPAPQVTVNQRLVADSGAACVGLTRDLRLRAGRFPQQSAETPMAETFVIDPQAIANLRSLNPGDNDEFLREITGIFLEDTPVRLAELDESYLSGDTGRFTRAAHSIKGSAANLGAAGLRAVAEKLENQSRTNGLANVAELVSQVKSEFARAEATLKQIVEGTAGR